MQTFRQLFEDKACDDAFRNLYEQECHVCSYTVRIFEKIEKLGMDLKTLAAELNMDLPAGRQQHVQWAEH